MLYKKSFSLLVIIVGVVAFLAFSSHKIKNERPASVVKLAALYKAEMERFDSALSAYPQYFPDSSYALRLEKYQRLAYQFKTVECFFAYFHPKLTYETFLLTAQFQARDFGPPFPDNWLWVGPFGINPDSIHLKKTRDDLLFEKAFIQRAVDNFKKVIQISHYTVEAEKLTEEEVFDALRLQMVRISTMELANGDFVIEDAGMPSLKGAFDSWAKMVTLLATERLPKTHAALKKSIQKKCAEGAQMLNSKPAFQSFNRMHFLTEILIPLSTQLKALREIMGVRDINKFSALNSVAKHVYDSNAFNANYFTPSEDAHISKAKAELGKLLFFDPVLSDNNERACASCHKPEKAFTDGAIKSLSFEKGDLPRNAPTVINSGFQKLQFWDLRATSLEDQLDSVVNSRDEMHSSFDNVIERLISSDEYKQHFYAAFPETKKTGIKRQHVKIAIATYERMLTGMNSRFDQYVRGNKEAMNASEINGFNVYLGKAKCGSCHYAPLFNGALPPYFDFTDHRSIGVPLKDSMKLYEVDPDMGFAKLNQSPFFNFSFKVPTVRNSALTAPYMHNGVFKTLEQVVDFYDGAGGNKFTDQMRPGMKGLPFFMILPEELKLTPGEKKDLVAFIRSLNDDSSTKNVPTKLPVLAGKYASWNKRRVGGIY